MTTEADRKMSMPYATVIEDDSVLKDIFVGAKIAATGYELQPLADDPLRPFGGFVMPQPLYYSRTLDTFFTLAPAKE